MNTDALPAFAAAGAAKEDLAVIEMLSLPQQVAVLKNAIMHDPTIVAHVVRQCWMMRIDREPLGDLVREALLMAPYKAVRHRLAIRRNPQITLSEAATAVLNERWAPFADKAAALSGAAAMSFRHGLVAALDALPAASPDSVVAAADPYLSDLRSLLP